ncbi:MAG: DUF202 domain-containing protein [Candidatus Diapherotrites archaeon]
MAQHKAKRKGNGKKKSNGQRKARARKTRSKRASKPRTQSRYSEAHEQTLLSEERTMLSKERTILQEITVYLALIAVGFGVVKVFENSIWLVSLGSIFVVLGVALIFASIYSYRKYNRKIKQIEQSNHFEELED